LPAARYPVGNGRAAIRRRHASKRSPRPMTLGQQPVKAGLVDQSTTYFQQPLLALA